MVVHPDRAFDDLRNTVHEYARILRHRWRLALLGLGIVGSIAFWVSQYLPRQYNAETIFERRDDVVLRNLIHSNSPYSFGQLRSSLTLDMTGSRALAEAAISTGLLSADAITSEGALTNDELRTLDEALATYDLNASVHMVQSSASLDTIKLSCTANDSAVACRFIGVLRDNYTRRTRERITEILSSTRDFFSSEASRFQQQVNEVNEQLKEQFADFPGVDPTDPVSAGARLEALQFESVRRLQRQAELEAQIAARERFLTSTLLTEPAEAQAAAAPTPVAPPVLPGPNSTIQQSVNQVEQQLADAILLKRMTNEHPTVRALRRKLESLYTAHHAATGSPANARADSPARRLREEDPVLAGQRLRVELELDALRAQLDIAAEHAEDAHARLDKFSALYGRLLEASDDVQQLQSRLEQDMATAAVWRRHLAQLERILAAESEQRGTQFALIEEPKESTHAVKPQAAAIFLVCLGCGLAAAALLVALAELIDHSFRSAGQVTRALGLPVLECIGVINTPRVRRQRLLGRLVWTPTLCILLGSLFGAASLAYSSLEHPDLHRRAIARIDSVLQAVGAPPTSLGSQFGQ